MSVCPWCSAAGFDPNAGCRSCGRRAPGRAASVSAVPELELDLSPSQKARAAPPAAARPATPPAKVSSPGMPAVTHDAQMSGRGAVFEADDDAFGEGDLSLELDVKPTAGSRAGALATVANPRGAVVQGGPIAPIKPAGPATPSFRPLPAAVAERNSMEPPPVETFEAKVLANFGDPPKHFWKAPLYAWRVRQRLQELRGELKEREKAAERARQQLAQSLVALGQRARATAERNPAYGRTLDGIRMQEQTLRQRDGVLMTEMDGHNKKLTVVDQKLTELQAQLGAAQAEERRLSDELTMAQSTVQRAEAKLKRLDIELRSAFGQSGPSGDGRRGGA